jgi:hypothetical protein
LIVVIKQRWSEGVGVILAAFLDTISQVP